MSKRTKAHPPAAPQALDAAAPAKPRVMDSFGLRSPPSKEARAAALLGPLTKDAAEMKRYARQQVDGVHAKFAGSLPKLGQMIKASRSALKIFNDRAEHYGEEPVSPAAANALDECAAEIDARIAREEQAAKTARDEMVRRIPRLAARFKAGRRPIPDEVKQLEDEAVALLRANRFSAADAKRLAREHLESEGLRAPRAPKQK